ncbi:YciI family protein [Chitinophaga nivalis]|uniref:YciI family protein n=1 Tax=Chitinophaga nivalis TaxID=2991709 RepID=A0ABT3IVD6_9BACT|nr:YciI family protein [Chitinophaga nivalis]MCW3462342.1 YciI family protein [Chitinophaga nivalis]MCW3487967.1 YciI family protein [Chitinophaga nivalis]
MFLILLQYIRPVAAVEHFMEAHTAFLQKHYDSGQFILSGRRKPKSGGLILCNASSRKEVEQIISEDPLEKYQLALYEIIEFEPTKYANTLEK